MEKPVLNSLQDIFNDLKLPPPWKSWKIYHFHRFWPSLSSQPQNHLQRQSPGHRKFKKKTLSDYKKDKIEKYVKYFKENKILPIPELVEVVDPKTLYQESRRIKKKKFEELLKTASISGRYFCQRSFATWDVLLPSEDLAKMLARNNITTKFFWLQPEYGPEMN